MNVVLAVFSMVGVVFGSGFISGKEIMVFFARFGYWSLLLNLLLIFAFYFIFKMLLTLGERAVERLKTSRLAFIVNLISSLCFASAMFAVNHNLEIFDNFFIKILIFIIIFTLSFLICKKGIGFLNKINLFALPISLLIFLSLLFKMLDFSSPLFQGENVIVAPFYSLLYVALNIATGAIMIASLGTTLSKRQKAQASAIASLVLCLILLIANLVLLQNPYAFGEQMPLRSLFKGKDRFLLDIVLLIGCNTTLFSLVFSISSSMRGLCKNEYLIYFISVISPFLISFLGFGFIVTYLYPFASVLGIILLLDLKFSSKNFGKGLSFKSFLKRTYKKIHSSRKNTK